VVPRLAAALEVSEDDIDALYAGGAERQPVVRQVLALSAPEPREPPVVPVLSVIALSNGRVRIKLDVELPGREGLALAQTLYGVQGLMGE
jgi:hypothetical protein